MKQILSLCKPTAAALVALLVSASTAFAVPIDFFSASQDIDFRKDEFVVDAGKRVMRDSASGADTLGGTRFLTLVTPQVDGPFPDFRAFSDLANAGVLNVSLGANVTGSFELQYDGDSSSVLNAQGLGGLNLLSDGSTAFVVKVKSYDFPFSYPLKIQVTAYTNANLVSTSTVELSAALVNQSVEIPFSSLQSIGQAGGVDLNKVGAINFQFNMTGSPAVDIELDSLTTNGTCGVVTFDRCNVCGGNDQCITDALNKCTIGAVTRSPYASLKNSGRREHRLVKFVINGEMKYRVKSDSLYRKFIRENEALLKQVTAAVNNLPRQDTVFSKACGCQIVSQAQTLKIIQDKGPQWVELAKRVITSILKVPSKKGGVCEGTAEECIDRSKLRNQRLNGYLEQLREMARGRREALALVPTETGSCSDALIAEAKAQ